MQKVRTPIVALILTAAVAAAYAQAPAKPAAKPAVAPAAAPAHVMMNAADLKWGPGPDALPAGVIRAKMPDGYKIPPHWHPTDESLTILSGSLMAGMGPKWDEASMKTFTTGGFARMPKKTPHYVMAKGETEIQVHAMGPFVLTYVNAKDDPRKKTQ